MPAVRLRWIAVGILLLSLLVHLTLLEWLKGELLLPTFDDEADQTISITLRPPPLLNPAPKATVRRPARAPLLPPETSADPTPDAPLPATNAVASEVQNETGSVSSHAAAAKEESLAQPDEAALPDTQPPLFERVSLPPPADLSYSVILYKEGRKVEGHGSISWQPGPTHYVISGEAGVLFFTMLNYKSSGSVDALGIAPELYVEKRFRKPETNTHFHRERKQISFSASTNSFPITGGEQDQASVIWQLASFGRGDAAKFVPGLAFDIVVASTRTASDWRVYVNGKESIDLAGSNTEAWHLTLTPTGQSYDKQFELWLAPDKEWYPVRLRYANTSDGYIEMMLTKLERR